MRKYWIFVAKFAVLGLILFLVIRWSDRRQWESLLHQPKNWWGLFASLAIVLAAHVLSFFRWAVFVHALGVPFSSREAIRLGFLGNLLNFVSFGAVGGDLFKAIAAARQARHKRPEVVASVLVDRAIGLLGLVLVAAVSLQIFGRNLSPTLDWIRRGAWLLSLLGLGALTLVVVVGHHLPRHWLKKIPLVGSTAYRMASAGMLFEKRPRLVTELILMSCVVHCLLTLGVYTISASLYPNYPSLQEHFITVPPAFAAAALPIAPGGLGVQEAVIAKLFEELPNIPADFFGLMVAVVYRLELLIIAGIGGIYYILGAREIKELQHEGESLPS